jgi:Tfp pilus assembly protein PilF
MDALKKAEEAKRQAGAPTPPADAPATAAAPEPGANRNGLPELPTSLELLDVEIRREVSSEPAVQAATHAAAMDQQANRAAAQNLFAAKQTPPRNTFPFIVGFLTLIALVGIGAYFWWQMQIPGGIAVQPALLTRQAASAAVQPIAQAPASDTESLPQPASDATLVPPGKTAISAANTQPQAPTIVSAEPARPAPAPIRITTSSLKVDPSIAQAYESFGAGDLDTAQGNYERVLKREPENAEALHGLAAISLRRGEASAAGHYYRLALEANPKDAVAQSGLIGLMDYDPLQAESRLKYLLAGQPDSPPLHFALGNLYARQFRWNEAQQAYFRAYSGDADNPDYLFNLAVSLEQLRQPKLALQYYQSALAAAAHRPAGFDNKQVEDRVRALQQ